MKKLGIVVPIYNAEPYLQQCVNSILEQTYTNFELVLVNDGSIDNSGKICDYFADLDSRVRVIHQHNCGKLFSRYIGLNNLECDYATFVDADDWIEKDTYKWMSDYIEQDIDVISFRIIRYFDDSYQYTSPNNYQQGLYNRQQIENTIYPTMIWDVQKGTFGLDPSLCNKVIKRELLINELYKVKDLKVDYGDDVAVIYPLMMQVNSLYITEESLYYHRQREGSAIAPYLSEHDFYWKLYLLYKYISKRYKEHSAFIRQLDYFYTNSVRLHLQIYGDRKKEKGELFPFDKVPKGSRIILYGASGLGQVYEKQFKKLNYGTILAWVDRDFVKYKNLGVRNIECINKIKDFDYIVIAVVNQETVDNIKKSLLLRGINNNKIICS